MSSPRVARFIPTAQPCQPRFSLAGLDPLRRRTLPGLLEPWHAHPDCHGPLHVAESGEDGRRLEAERVVARDELRQHIAQGSGSSASEHAAELGGLLAAASFSHNDKAAGLVP